jgi:hypothetical protein
MADVSGKSYGTLVTVQIERPERLRRGLMDGRLPTNGQAGHPVQAGLLNSERNGRILERCMTLADPHVCSAAMLRRISALPVPTG